MKNKESEGTYVDLGGNQIPFGDLDEAERELLAIIKCKARTSDWDEFSSFWMKVVSEFYDGRRLSRRDSANSVLFRIAQDLSSRLAMQEGAARTPDYREELEDLIMTRYKTKRDFCEATGISEDMLSHVLARRKHLGISTLSDALKKIGYGIHIVPTLGRRDDSAPEKVSTIKKQATVVGETIACESAATRSSR